MGFVVGEVLFFSFGREYAFGLWYGVTVSLGLSFILVARALKYLDHRGGVDKITWKVASSGLVRLLFYGISLAVSTLTDELNFFATAGGLVIPTLALQTSQALNVTKPGGNDA
ncbi:MAG: hypothetical protein ACLFVS_05615 [Candidatus Acetothermia bacterium]